jgi:hypothetical protein
VRAGPLETPENRDGWFRAVHSERSHHRGIDSSSLHAATCELRSVEARRY